MVGLLYTDDSDVFVADDYLYWNNHAMGTLQTSDNAVYMQISPYTTDKTVNLILYIAYETWYGEVIIDEHQLVMDVKSLQLSEFDAYYTVDNSINGAGTTPTGTLAPGLYSEMGIWLELDDGAIMGATATLSTETENVYVINDTVNYGYMFGDSSTLDEYETGYNDLLVYTGANFAGGSVEFTLNVTYFAFNGSRYSELYSISISDVAQGDVQDPTYSYSSSFDSCVDENTQVSFEIDLSDNIGIDTVYFFYYFDTGETTNWTIEEHDAEGILSGTLTVDLELGEYDFIYGFAILDVSNNLVIAGEDGSLTIDICETSDTTDSSDTTSDTTSTTESDTGQDTSQNTPDPDIPGFQLYLVLTVMLLAYPLRKISRSKTK